MEHAGLRAQGCKHKRHQHDPREGWACCLTVRPSSHQRRPGLCSRELRWAAPASVPPPSSPDTSALLSAPWALRICFRDVSTSPWTRGKLRQLSAPPLPRVSLFSGHPRGAVPGSGWGFSSCCGSGTPGLPLACGPPGALSPALPLVFLLKDELAGCRGLSRPDCGCGTGPRACRGPHCRAPALSLGLRFKAFSSSEVGPLWGLDVVFWVSVSGFGEF